MVLKSGKNIRLFKNSLLETMTFVHPLWPILLWGPVIIACTWVSISYYSVLLFIILFCLGFFFWSYTEYVLHRFLFHYLPTSQAGKRFIFLVHGIHHDDPDDQRRLLMPPIPAIVLASFFYLAFCTVLGFQYAQGFFAGFMVGYLCYDYIHFFSHYGRYQNGIMKILQQNHMRHHFKNDGKLYGVSSPLWDYIFNTK